MINTSIHEIFKEDFAQASSEAMGVYDTDVIEKVQLEVFGDYKQDVISNMPLTAYAYIFKYAPGKPAIKIKVQAHNYLDLMIAFNHAMRTCLMVPIRGVFVSFPCLAHESYDFSLETKLDNSGQVTSDPALLFTCSTGEMSTSEVRVVAFNRQDETITYHPSIVASSTEQDDGFLRLLAISLIPIGSYLVTNNFKEAVDVVQSHLDFLENYGHDHPNPNQAPSISYEFRDGTANVADLVSHSMNMRLELLNYAFHHEKGPFAGVKDIIEQEDQSDE